MVRKWCISVLMCADSLHQNPPVPFETYQCAMWPFGDSDPDSKPKKSCEKQRQLLQDCLLTSKCVNLDGYTPKQCLKMKDHSRVPDICFNYQYDLFLCKRSMIDMRARFRGRRGVDYDEIHHGPKKEER